MPIYYNTNSPTPTTLNSINSVSINIRDFLLNQNISSTYPSISTAVNGSPQVGQPVLDTESNHLNFYPHQQLDLNTTGLDVLGSVLNGQGVGIGAGGSVVPNFDVRSSLAGRVLGATGLLNDTKIGTVGAQQLALALANNAAFNVQQELLGAFNVQDNVLALIGGKPLPGFRPSYQITIPSGPSGRVGDFAGKMLGFTIPRSYLGPEGSIFQDENGDAENIKRANSMILNTGKGQVLALLANAKANLAVNSTQNPFRVGYAPGFTDNKGEVQLSGAKLYAYTDKEGKFIHLLGSLDNKGVIPNLSYNREEKISVSGFLSPEETITNPSPGNKGFPGYDNRLINSEAFSWTSNEGGTVNNIKDNDVLMDTNQKSLLVKTQKLFNSVGMQNIVTSKGDMFKSSTQISQANGGGFSKGNAVLQKHLFTNGRLSAASDKAEDTYCRSWTTVDRYDKIGKLVRSGTDGENGIYGRNSVAYRGTDGGSVGSVLGKYGFPKITPYTTDKTTDLKQYMFSIENLAWADRTNDLPDAEIGPGDLLNNKKGRIMWFPPYDITFSESNNVSWESTNFIGRGEPVYTYNNTERAGNLSFKVVVDHPSHVNSFRDEKGPDDHYINSFWAGCIPPELSVNEKNWSELITHMEPQKNTVIPEPAPDVKLCVFFPNDRSDLPPDGYENGLSGSSTTSYIDYYENSMGYGYGINKFPAQATSGLHLQNHIGWIDNTNYGMNGYSVNYGTPVFFADTVFWGWRDRVLLMAEVDKYLKEKCPHCIVKVKGFASQQGLSKPNSNLVKNRALNVIKELKKYLFKDLTPQQRDDRFKYEQGYVPETAGCRVGIESDIEYLPCKKDRRAEITFEWDEELAKKEIKLPDLKVVDGTRNYTKKITDRYNETLYFDQLTDADPLVFDSFREKIKYFHPAFHSTSPEGLNSRLTFLLQCTRQGPTSETQGPNNLAFGRPPVCILRIGDFYNTKIIMDSVNIDYDPLVWDLNPEGIGVQPMIANVTISFKFLGGSSLMGPINKLQNALSFNYFANTQVYDARADYISKNKPTWNVKDKDGKDIIQTPSDSLSGYYINDGVKNYKSKSSEELTWEDVLVNKPEVDQVSTQDNAAGDAQETSLSNTPGTIDDKEVISLIGLVGFKTYDFDNTKLDLVFGWSPNSTIKTLNMDATLAKTYKGQVYVINGETITNIGYVSIRSNGLDNGCVFKTDTGNENIIGPDIINTLSWSNYLILNDTQNTAVAAAFKKSSSIKIEWETGLKNNIGFNESLVINI
jgi:hypothetical protein